MPITLTNDNYFSQQADMDYMSVSQFKALIGTQAHSACEATALKHINHEIEEQKTTALLVGSYVDAYFEGTLDAFKAENPEIFKTTGDKGLKADYVQAQKIIDRTNRDKLFSDFMNGQKQVIMTANLFGVDWKIKMDSYHPKDKIVDLKIMKDMLPMWSPAFESKVDFIRFWGYDIQGAVYQRIVEILTGDKLPFFIACATKEKEAGTDIQVIEITQPYLDAALSFVENNIEHAVAVKNGTIEAKRCGTCAICRDSRILKAPIRIDDIIPNANTKLDTGENIQGYSLFGN